ncbi:MAG: alpha/beta hydrolase [Cyclobacteriaceae bacterium]
MNRCILFIQGGGEGGYEADIELVASLQTALGKNYDINYPKMPSDESASDFGWLQQIGKKIYEIKSDVILAGHSLGASMILKYLSENSVDKKIEGIFLMATPFWSGNEDWKQGLKLHENFADELPDETPIFFYHCQDDEEIPISHLNYYKQKLTQATFREIKSGGHQLNNDLTLVSNDIKTL